MFEGIWVEKYRPPTINDLVLSKEVRSYINSLKEKQEIPHLLLHGNPGGGKTTLAKLIPKELLQCSYRYINASDQNGIDTVRTIIIGFAQTKSFDGKIKIFILDEFENFSKEGQRALNNIMEEYSDNIRFILTANNIASIIKPIISRCQSINMIPPLQDAIQRIGTILKTEKITIQEDSKKDFASNLTKLYPDVRRMIQFIQRYTKNNIFSLDNTKVDIEFSNKIIEMILNKDDICNIRKVLIDNGLEYNNDFSIFIKSIFESVYKLTNIDIEKKKKALITVGEFLHKHITTLDPEINTYCLLLELTKIL